MIPLISMTRNGYLLNLIILLSPWSCISFLAAESATTTSTSKSTTTTTTTTTTNGVNDNNNNDNSPYKIIFDGGSTGSRLHIFEFVEVIDDDDDEENNDQEESTSRSSSSSSSSDIDIMMMSYTTTSDINFSNIDIINNNNNNNKPENKKKIIQCIRRGSSRADIPLSAFGRLPSELINNNSNILPLNPTEVAAHLLPLFEYAANIIPSQYYESTGVYYQATAGMRLLEESEQNAVYDALYQGLIDDQSFVFRGIQRKDISTLSGQMEAYYGALSANYILGLIDSELRVLSPNEEDEKENEQQHPVGALDMGGSSTQIVYIAANNNNDKIDISTTDSPTTCPIIPLQPQQQPSSASPQNEFNDNVVENTCQLSDEHFFSTSYLSYGVDQFRERLWGTLVEEYILSVEEENNNNPDDDDDDDDTCDAKVVANPCANKGFEVEYNGYTLLGTGDTKECIRQTKRLIPHPEIPYDDYDDNTEWVVGGVEHPPIRGKFLAMSLYFFSLDSLRVFSQPDEEAHVALNHSWPNPSIDELYKALDGLCSRDWHGDMALQEGVHAFTRAEVLPHRCLETVYMVTLLKDGFGFHPSSRDITFTFLVDGDEVEWTLGMALAMNADERGSTNNNNFDKNDKNEVEQKDDDSNNLNEIMNNTIEDETEDQFHLEGVSMLSHMFGVTLPPTHCC
jgi:Golgi nucleoside diphosphatase